MGEPVPLMLPRWEWRTVSPDLSWLLLRAGEPFLGPERSAVETHLLCSRSSHDAVLRDGVLEVRWRKERHAAGFELWDVVLRCSLPFSAADVDVLWTVWQLPPRRFETPFPTIASFLREAVESEPAIVPVVVTRATRLGLFQGIACSIEKLQTGCIGLQSFSLEHEDPSLIAQALDSLGLKPDANINLPDALRGAIGFDARGQLPWPRKSNASTW